MSGWRSHTIREIVSGLFDGPHATPPPATDGPVFLGIGNVTEDGHLDLSQVRHIAEEDYARWTKRVTPSAGDIVFTYEATLNRYAIIPKEFRGCLGRRMALIRPNPDRVDTRFLFYSFFGKQWRDTIEANRLSGATVDRIPIAKFPSFPIELPSLPEQRRIASILGTYDDLIEVNRRRIAVLEAMARGLFEDQVAKPVGGLPSASVRATDKNFPESWALTDLRNLAEITMGQSPPSSEVNLDGQGIPFHQGVSDFGALFPGCRAFSTIQGSKKLGREGDVLFSVRAPVGRINLAAETVILGRGVSSIRSKTGHRHFLVAHLRATFYEPDLIGNGAIYKAVNRSDMDQIQIVLPPKDILDRVDATLGDVYGLLWNLERANRSLAAARDLLLPRLISGELSVAEATRKLEAVA